MKKNTDTGLLILRLSVAGLMLLHGLSKLLHGIGPIAGLVESKSLPAFFAYGVYVGEVLAPLAIIIGFRTRIAALIFFINTIVAALLAHSNEIFSLSQTGGWAVELLGLYGFGALVLMFTGAGRFAVSTRSRWD